jgi:hypothetical protein
MALRLKRGKERGKEREEGKEREGRGEEERGGKRKERWEEKKERDTRLGLRYTVGLLPLEDIIIFSLQKNESF